MTDTFSLPPPPDPVKVEQLAGQIRALLPFIGGGLAAAGIVIPSVSDAQLSGYISAAMVLAGFASYGTTAVWSWYQKIRARKLLVASSVASANTGMPVAVTVTPEGMPNVATQISVAEQLQAPSVPQGVAPMPPPMPTDADMRAAASRLPG